MGTAPSAGASASKARAAAHLDCATSWMDSSWSRRAVLPCARGKGEGTGGERGRLRRRRRWQRRRRAAGAGGDQAALSRAAVMPCMVMRCRWWPQALVWGPQRCPPAAHVGLAACCHPPSIGSAVMTRIQIGDGCGQPWRRSNGRACLFRHDCCSCVSSSTIASAWGRERAQGASRSCMGASPVALALSLATKAAAALSCALTASLVVILDCTTPAAPPSRPPKSPHTTGVRPPPAAACAGWGARCT